MVNWTDIKAHLGAHWKKYAVGTASAAALWLAYQTFKSDAGQTTITGSSAPTHVERVTFQEPGFWGNSHNVDYKFHGKSWEDFLVAYGTEYVQATPEDRLHMLRAVDLEDAVQDAEIQEDRKVKDVAGRAMIQWHPYHLNDEMRRQVGPSEAEEKAAKAKRNEFVEPPKGYAPKVEGVAPKAQAVPDVEAAPQQNTQSTSPAPVAVPPRIASEHMYTRVQPQARETQARESLDGLVQHVAYKNSSSLNRETFYMNQQDLADLKQAVPELFDAKATRTPAYRLQTVQCDVLESMST
ncbi:MAG: hypothetical protein AABY13_06160, partial [Nanoarchaeota archaeon]